MQKLPIWGLEEWHQDASAHVLCLPGSALHGVGGMLLRQGLSCPVVLHTLRVQLQEQVS